MRVDTEAGRAILDELARVQVAILVMEVTLTLGETEAPITFISGAIGPRLHSFSMLNENFLWGIFILYYFDLAGVYGTLADLKIRLVDDLALVDGLNLRPLHL